LFWIPPDKVVRQALIVMALDGMGALGDEETFSPGALCYFCALGDDFFAGHVFFGFYSVYTFFRPVGYALTVIRGVHEVILH
jgi:hypothetical protein